MVIVYKSVTNAKPRAKNPLRVDPTRTTMLRKELMADMARRFAALRRAIVQLVDVEDAFGIRANAKAAQSFKKLAGDDRQRTIPWGVVVANEALVINVLRRVGDRWYVYSEGGKRLSKGYQSRKAASRRLHQIEYFKHKGPTSNQGPVINTRWRFETDDKKLTAYRSWLKEQTKAGILEVSGPNKETPWLEPYIGSAYKKGLMRAYTDAHATDIAAASKDWQFFEGGKKEFLRSSFGGPTAQAKMRMLSTRAYSQLEGVTAQMDQEMSRILAQGIANGSGPDTIARELTKSVSGLEKKRAMTIARTEIIHAHAEAQLDAFEAMNIEEVNVMAEWSTARDSVVCEECAPLEGIILTVSEARGMIPRHPNCRCAWKPANVGEHIGGTVKHTWAGPAQGLEEPGTLPTGKTTGQTWGKAGVAASLRKSIEAEHPKLSAVAARKASRWVGADLTTVSGKLKPGSKKWLEAKAAKIAKAKAKAKAAARAARTRAAKKAEAKAAIAAETIIEWKADAKKVRDT